MEMIMRSYPNGWLTESIMHQKGVGGGSSGVTHELTEEKQGDFHYTIGPYSEAVLHIKPGDQVIVETLDAFAGKITSESDVPSEILEMPWLNPQCGPIMVEGAEKGDALAVHIESMLPRGPQPRGTCCMIKEFGGLTNTYYAGGHASNRSGSAGRLRELSQIVVAGGNVRVLWPQGLLLDRQCPLVEWFGLGRAEALRRSMMALMMDHEDPRFAHPFYWAPFVIVGEGGVPADRATSVQ